MAYFGTIGGDPPRRYSSCLACKQPITDGQHSTRVEFQNDPDGSAGLSGLYHTACSRPYQSLARVVNMNPWTRF
jgi:hypothetical protein